MIEAVLVGVGGAIGAVLRYLVGLAVGPVSGRFPAETLVVNVVGSFVLGWVTFGPVDGNLSLFVGVGACGAFTTFSSFSVDTVRLVENESAALAAIYAGVNVALSVGAVLAAALVATV
ncbi:fluoride efflux transporter CrcB [Halalkalicoccus subterraneus]|uniref:fluoride efflux transporter CrcB n=1 Tax=Halalkalicoccus subterraneus TaxID=2675002 RepID=UPI000EFA7B0E|nr:fluoride efflux transporter CrcB [Halalkalicoccus subterraneus]